MPFREFIVKREKAKKPTNGKKRVLEVGDRRLYRISEVRQMLDLQSRAPFADLLALMLGAHPTEEALLAFAEHNPDKWANAVRTFATLTGYREEIEVTHNVYARVVHMSDMDLEHQLRDVLNKTGDSHLVDPAEITTPYKRVNQRASALKRISRN